MKSPDEIKKGLAACSSDECHGQHAGCTYQDQFFCTMRMCGDALAYINQLEQRLAQAERERDAAVECIEKAYKTMDRVVHKPAETIQNLREGRKIIYDYCAVKWRGVCEGSSKEEKNG